MSKAKLTFLGTGTSQGIPMIGCGCEVCSSTDPQDKRLRSSVFVEYEGLKILVDAGPDFRYQMLREGITNVDAILLTHNHKDHISGLASLIKKTNIKIFIPIEMYDGIKELVPKDRCVFIDDIFNIKDVQIELIHTSHDAPCSLGFIITYNDKSLVYITDTGYINRKYLSKMTRKDLYLIESNHDEVMLMDGPYPRFLKERVISDKGHLSNTTTV